MLMMLIVSQVLSKSLQSETGKLYAIKCDVTKNSCIEMAFKWVKDNLGGVDILVNNAGVLFNCPLVGKSPRQLLIVLMVWFLDAKLRKVTLAPSCASVCSHGTTRLPIDRYS